MDKKKKTIRIIKAVLDKKKIRICTVCGSYDNNSSEKCSVCGGKTRKLFTYEVLDISEEM